MLDFESCQSLEKLVIDNDACGMAYRLLDGIAVRNIPLAFDVLMDVGHQSGFLDHPHTREWYRAEQSLPRILDRETYDSWVAAGKPDLAERASTRVRTLLGPNAEPPLAHDKREMLQRIMADRARQSGLGPLPFHDYAL
jgi:trimethylamine--corrinoid protein Co-methyltransferase